MESQSEVTRTRTRTRSSNKFRDRGVPVSHLSRKAVLSTSADIRVDETQSNLQDCRGPEIMLVEMEFCRTGSQADRVAETTGVWDEKGHRQAFSGG